jgi:hypothetical protein
MPHADHVWGITRTASFASPVRHRSEAFESFLFPRATFLPLPLCSTFGERDVRGAKT